MTKKNRIPIPNDTAAEILFLSDRTCCVCNTRGKQVQIHHIDEDPSNNSIENLSILCFECHDQTMIRGGFGRKLEANQIIKYKTDWLTRVKNRKEKADEIASIQTVTGSTENVIANEINESESVNYSINNDPELLKNYIEKILIIHKAQLMISQTKWDSGYNYEMNQGTYDMIDFYEEVLNELSTFYAKGHFNNMHPKKYFSELISSRFLWHRLVLEPGGVETGGTIITTIVGGNVMQDLKLMIVDMVCALIWPYEIEKSIDMDKWRIEWLK